MLKSGVAPASTSQLRISELPERSFDSESKSIGVSNFTPEHLATLIGETGVAPAVNQIELHPYFQREEPRVEPLGCDTLIDAHVHRSH